MATLLGGLCQRIQGVVVVGMIAAGIPAFNEEKTIGSVVLSASRFVDQVIVVDDGSTDATAEIAKLAGATVITHGRNLGYGAAIRSCLDYARSDGIQYIVIFDADGQHRPEQIPKVLEPLLQGRADLSIGSRFVNRNLGENVPMYRRLGIGLITRMANLGAHSDTRVEDAQSGFRAYSRRAIDAIEVHESDMGASVEILWEAGKKGLKVEEVPIRIDYDVDGSTKGPMQHGLEVMASMVRYAETEHPLLVFSIPGLAIFVGGLFLGVNVIHRYYTFRELPVGFALITVLTLTAGMLLGFTGLTLHAVISVAKRFRQYT